MRTEQSAKSIPLTVRLPCHDKPSHIGIDDKVLRKREPPEIVDGKEATRLEAEAGLAPVPPLGVVAIR